MYQNSITYINIETFFFLQIIIIKMSHFLFILIIVSNTYSDKIFKVYEILTFYNNDKLYYKIIKLK